MFGGSHQWSHMVLDFVGRFLTFYSISLLSRLTRFSIFVMIDSVFLAVYLEKAMATHSSTLAWQIPRMKEPVRLQSMGSQSRTQLSAPTHTHTCTHTYTPKDGKWIESGLSDTVRSLLIQAMLWESAAGSIFFSFLLSIINVLHPLSKANQQPPDVCFSVLTPHSSGPLFQTGFPSWVLSSL